MLALRDAGAVWLRESKKGTKYLRGTIEINGQQHRIQLHKNGFKKTDKHPDYKISLEIPDEEQEEPRTWSGNEAPAKVDDSDVPF
jgi:hypothetical protein